MKYIGITDFMSPWQVRKMANVFTCYGGHKLCRKLMVGVMMSRKTLNGIPTKWAAAFPPADTISGIFTADERVFNTLHYADYDAIDVEVNLARATAYGGPYMHALQLDMIWPDAEIVRRYRERYPDIQVIIQGNSKAMEMVDDDPRLFVRRLSQYGDTIDFVLLDKSMGRGLGMDACSLLPFARAVADTLPYLGIAAAGGLGPETTHLVEPLAVEFPDISIDAQGKLRQSGSALDPIDWHMADTYVRRAIELFGKYQKAA